MEENPEVWASLDIERNGLIDMITVEIEMLAMDKGGLIYFAHA